MIFLYALLQNLSTVVDFSVTGYVSVVLKTILKIDHDVQAALLSLDVKYNAIDVEQSKSS